MTSRIYAPLDPDFSPAIIFNRAYLAQVKASGLAVPLVIGLERENGTFSRYETQVFPTADEQTIRYVERLVKFLLWARGGWKLVVGGPAEIGAVIAAAYCREGARAFDVELMSRVYERPFVVESCEASAVPAANEMSATLGGHLDGCRIGFDLGASDFKVAAVNEGEVVYSDEFPWDPKNQADPAYHYDRIQEGFKKAATFLPRVDVIGGSSAGVIVANKFMVASLLRSIPESRLEEARSLFHRLGSHWQVPLEVVNDGDVTALAGAMSIGENAMLGLAMGSSEAAGYLNREGRMTGWLSELAFAPIDYNRDALADEWSGDSGVGVLYFSQQAVNRLLPAAGIDLPASMGLPEKLKAVQALMAENDPRAATIYETIGIYLGYTIPHYAEFYDYSNLLVLGRVMTGVGGEIILATARNVLETEFPEVARQIELHVPDEKSRRVGQAIAAASLPRISSPI